MSASLGEISEGLSALYSDAIQKMMENQNSILRAIMGTQRKGHYEADEELLSRFRAFEERWNATVAEGEENGFLSYNYGEGYDLYEPRGKWVYDETEEEFEQRKKRESCDIGAGGHVVFPVAKGPSE